MSKPEQPGSEAGTLAEMPREGALVAEAVREGDGGDGIVGSGQAMRGGLAVHKPLST